MSRLAPLVLAAGTLAACANQGRDPAVTAQGPAAGTEVDEATFRREAEARAGRESVPVSRRLHAGNMSEAVLDPTGSAALTLDASGGVRLWTDLHPESVQSPIELPVFDPAWMSLARSGTGAWVAGFIDASGGAVIGRLSAATGGGRWTPLLEIPSTAPLFELHVFDGGQRILGLSVDHRVYLWNGEGQLLSVLDEPGFVPWQLRVAQPAEGTPAVVAVLAGPVRVQPLALEGDRVETSGEAYPVALDRGPNRNDLSLSPDGTTVFALQGPAKRSKRFEVEALDLRSGARRIVAAETDASGHPRLHPLAADRVLLETGSGRGYYADLSSGIDWPPPSGDADREALALSTLRGTALPESDEFSRVHASIVAGVRVVPSPWGLTVDPLDGEARRLLSRGFEPAAVALDADGGRVAWGTEKATWVEDVGGSAEPREVAAPAGGPRLLAFVGGEHFAAMNETGALELRRVADGELVDRSNITIAWGLAASAWRPGKSGAGQLVVSSSRPAESLHVLDVSPTGFASARRVPRGDQSQWPEAGKPRNMDSRDWIEALGLEYTQMGLRPAKVESTDPDPTGRYLAIAQKTEHHEDFDQEADRWVVGPHDYVLTVYDRAQERRRWSVAVPALADVAWSADGGRLAVAFADGGLVLDAETGQTVHERHDLGLSVVAVP